MGHPAEGEYHQDVEDEVHGRIAEEESDGAAANQSAARSKTRMTTAAWRRTGHSSAGLCGEHRDHWNCRSPLRTAALLQL